VPPMTCSMPISAAALVPTLADVAAGALGQRGMYFIMEQAGRINSQCLLELKLANLAHRYPRTEFFLVQPPATGTPLFGPSMGFEANRAALRYGYTSSMKWLRGPGAALIERLGAAGGSHQSSRSGRSLEVPWPATDARHARRRERCRTSGGSSAVPEPR
jgi:hypothetical protein